MSDNSYGTTFGPSTPGALNLTAGQTYGVICGSADGVVGAAPCAAGAAATPGRPQPAGPGTVYGDPDPYFDRCSGSPTMQMGGRNVGDLLDAAHVTWGWFQGGFASPGYVPGRPSTDDLSAVCTGTHRNIGGATVKDYSPHHERFQYYASTANPRHLPPTSVAAIGHQDQANHQYDIADFWAVATNGNLPAVSFLKAAKYQDGHAGRTYSDPLDEQRFLVGTINRLQHLPTWRDTAVVIAYDDSDGWYDHQPGPLVVQSQTPLDALTGTGQCGANPAGVPTGDGGTPEQARCGYGPRLPLLVISPYSRRNAVDSTLTDQSSVLRFIEDNWLGGQRLGDGSSDAWAGSLDGLFDFAHPVERKLFLDPVTGEPANH